MSVRIRLRRVGRKKQPSYRIVVAPSDAPRDGQYLDSVGFYNPRTNPAQLDIDLGKVDDWIRRGAKPTETVESLVRKARRGGDKKVAVRHAGAAAVAEAEAESSPEAAAPEAEAEAPKPARASKKAQPPAVEPVAVKAEAPSDEAPADEAPAAVEAEAEAEAPAEEPAAAADEAEPKE
jgi:small subunit ribosomal protein S16